MVKQNFKHCRSTWFQPHKTINSWTRTLLLSNTEDNNSAIKGHLQCVLIKANFVNPGFDFIVTPLTFPCLAGTPEVGAFTQVLRPDHVFPQESAVDWLADFGLVAD